MSIDSTLRPITNSCCGGPFNPTIRPPTLPFSGMLRIESRRGPTGNHLYIYVIFHINSECIGKVEGVLLSSLPLRFRNSLFGFITIISFKGVSI